jgi:HPt (histidine-containing phosphotransfer) domain-containing protein
MAEVDALLTAAREQYAARLPSKIAVIEALAAREAWDEARREAHKLRGSAATYGFEALGDAARSIEQLATEASLDPTRARGAMEEALQRARVEVDLAAGGSR